MKELRNYIFVGVLTGLVIYFISPGMFGNRIEIIEATPVKSTGRRSQSIGQTKEAPS